MSIKVKMLRLLTKRPYGLAKFRVGNTWYSKIVNFTRDSCDWFGGMYSFNRDLITIEKGAGNRKSYRQSDYVNFESGYPILYFDVNSGVPLHFEGDKSTSSLPTAKAMQSTVKKWIIASEMEMMRKQKNKIMTAIIIGIIMSLICMCVSIYLVIKLGNIEAGIGAMQGAINNIVPLVAGG